MFSLLKTKIRAALLMEVCAVTVSCGFGEPLMPCLRRIINRIECYCFGSAGMTFFELASYARGCGWLVVDSGGSGQLRFPAAPTVADPNTIVGTPRKNAMPIEPVRRRGLRSHRPTGAPGHASACYIARLPSQNLLTSTGG
jgi:hypothetical protein